jgi:hypothetical protein
MRLTSSRNAAGQAAKSRSPACGRQEQIEGVDDFSLATSSVVKDSLTTTKDRKKYSTENII